MIIAFSFSASGAVCCRGGREVTRAKKFMSDFMRGHGRVPFRPMPSRGFVVVAGALEMGVVATMRVRVIVLLAALIWSELASEIEGVGETFILSFGFCDGSEEAFSDMIWFPALLLLSVLSIKYQLDCKKFGNFKVDKNTSVRGAGKKFMGTDKALSFSPIFLIHRFRYLATTGTHDIDYRGRVIMIFSFSFIYLVVGCTYLRHGYCWGEGNTLVRDKSSNGTSLWIYIY